ncbi:MAG: tetratricopeptide repeat protein [Synechococcaceae cyanobacterium SM2_3_1]|nr:tetratricopeptide repeat protein [Synechococcaceae cyanobacterium SM2_3_1]
MQAGDLDTAVEELKAALSINPQAPLFNHQMGRLLLKQGDPMRALDYLRKARQQDPHLVNIDADLAQTLLQFALQLLGSGRTQEALTQLKTAMAMDLSGYPMIQADIQHQLGRICIRQQRWAQASKFLQTALELNPDLAAAHVAIGWVQSCQGHQAEAIDAYWAALGLDDSLAEAHYHMGIALSRQGQLKAAVAAYRTALNLAQDPEMIRTIHSYLGIASVRTGEIEAAERIFRQVLQEDPHLAIAHYGLGQVLASRGQHDTAVQSYEQALELDPALLSASAAIGLTYLARKQQSASGRKYIHSRQAEAAIARFEQVLRKDATVADAHFGMGEVFRIRGNLLFALRSYQAAVDADGSFTPAHFRMGIVCAVLGRNEKAVEELRTTLQLSPHYPDAEKALNRVLAKQMAEITTEVLPW